MLKAQGSIFSTEKKSHFTDEKTKSQAVMAKARAPQVSAYLSWDSGPGTLVLPLKASSGPGVDAVPPTQSIIFATQADLIPVQTPQCKLGEP